MAGSVAARLASLKRVKKVIMLSSVNYSMQNSPSYSHLKSVINPESVKSKF
ncbi:UNVERIFIED_CONTAM: hypothetical protein O8I53_07620 [Campylobacter lari]